MSNFNTHYTAIHHRQATYNLPVDRDAGRSLNRKQSLRVHQRVERTTPILDFGRIRSGSKWNINNYTKDQIWGVVYNARKWQASLPTLHRNECGSWSQLFVPSPDHTHVHHSSVSNTPLAMKISQEGEGGGTSKYFKQSFAAQNHIFHYLVL